VGVFGAPDYSELAVDGTIGNLGYDDWSYLVGNIYNWSTGSRGDGANDLHYLYENATEPQLRKFARERLDYLAETEPDPQLRYYVSDILHKECTSSAINVDSLLEIELVPHPVSLISVSGGEFLMGTNDTRFNTAERPQHVLNLQSFQISRTLITVGQFAEYIRATGAAIPRNWESVDWVVSHIDHPVTSVTWHEAYFFCAWLQEKLRAYDLIRSDDYVRLPTEAEWEKAARGTDGRLYPWGEDFDYRKCNTKTAGLRSTTPVGLFSPQGDSPYGCADMVGNAREWTCSLWGTAGNIPSFRYPYTIADGRDLISAPDSVRRVIRGGGYYYDDDCANCVVRNRAFAHNRHAAGGFRIVVSGRMLR
jgi:formylglycine-generating enzyme required for sulfatase activity